MTYVIRNNNVGNYNDVHASTEDKLVQCISLPDPNTRGDKDTVNSLLHQYLRETECKSTIETYEISHDGRRVYLSQKLAIETGSYASNLKITATSMMNNAVYKGEHKNFNVDTYHSLNTRAHNMLVDGESLLGENVKITNFKNGIV